MKGKKRMQMFLYTWPLDSGGFRGVSLVSVETPFSAARVSVAIADRARGRRVLQCSRLRRFSHSY